MKWFKHHTDAHDNNKLTKVRMKYGAEGYAIYWYCLELIAGDLGGDKKITFELKHDSEVIGFNLKIDSRRVEEIMTYMVGLELFENAEGVITCLKLAKNLDKKTTRNKTIHRIIDEYNSLTVPRLSPDCPPTNDSLSPDCPGMSPLDTDTDTDKKHKHLYQDDFEGFWIQATAIYKSTKSNTGSKAEASKEFKKIKPSADEINQWINAMQAQAKAHQAALSRNQFSENFKHVCRWIKYRCFEVVPTVTEMQQRNIC